MSGGVRPASQVELFAVFGVILPGFRRDSNSADKPLATTLKAKSPVPRVTRKDLGYNMAMEPIVEKQHIVVTPGTCGGKPRIAGTRIRVVDIVLWNEAGRSPEEIVRDYPHLSLADVHAALTYYFDHREEIDRHLRDADALIERMKVDSALTSRQTIDQNESPVSPG
jgi:uncharacterized protein (DUF433 family)